MSVTDEVIAEGKHLRFLRRGGWEMVSRRNVSGIVGIVAVTDAGKLVLVEQERPPVGRRVIELPAGLAGDIAGSEKEDLETAARRELLEETGYEAAEMARVAAGTSSAGLCDEIVTLFIARKLKRVDEAQGDGSEAIVVHEVELSLVRKWLEGRLAEGRLVDLKVYAGLYFALTLGTRGGYET